MTSNLGPIPAWDTTGLLPPFLESPTSAEGRSPYRVRLADIVLRFGDTPSRRILLTGLLDYRAALHAAGVQDGFQWLNGSFVEDKMGRLGREPNDIDIVTFLHLPTRQTQQTFAEAYPVLFDSRDARNRYGADAYPMVLDGNNPSYLVVRAAYWNSVWSHDRSHQWKGYLEIDLSDSEDAAARAALEAADKWEAEE